MTDTVIGNFNSVLTKKRNLFMQQIKFSIKPLLLISACIFVCSCIVKPAKVSSYDAGCDMGTKKYELTVEQVNMFEDIDCANGDCKVQIVAEVLGSAMITPLSAIVSSSIAVVGNTLYWVEKKGKCH